MTEETKDKFKLNPKNKKLIIIVACIFVVAAIATTVIIVVLSHRETVGDILELGDRYMSEMDYESAIREYKRAIEIDPKSEDAYLKLAEAYIAIGDRDSAIEALEDGYEATQSDRILERLNELREELHTPEHAKELSVATEPDKLEYYVGETLDLTGLTFTVTYEDGTTEEISEGYTYDVKTLEESGTVEVTVEYGGAKATVNVTVVENPGTETEPSETEPSPTEPSPTEPSPTEPSPTEPSPTEPSPTGPSKTETAETEPPMTDAPVPATLTGISIKTQPKKTTYYVGEKLDTSGLTLTAAYSDGKAETITSGFTCSPTTLNTAGTQKITVTYGGKTATVNVTVKEPTLAEDFTWTLENGVLTLSGHGLMPDYDEEYTAPWYESTYEIERVVINDGIQNIDNYAFWCCFNISTITIPDSVTNIEERAFRGCDNLTTITIPDSVTSMGVNAFGYCSALTEISVDKDNPNYCSMGGVLFSKDMKTLIACPAGISGNYSIPNSVTSIGNRAFDGCTGLTTITIPDSVTTIGEEVFWSCDKLTTIMIPASVTSIGKYAFICCGALTEISVDKNNPNYCSMGGVLFSKDMKTLIACPAGMSGNYSIPNSVMSIGDNAFYDCSELSTITIPDSVMSIGDNAFYDCSELSTITIPDSVTSIGDDAFFYCISLKSITIPNSVTSIGDYTFSSCFSLTTITIPDSVLSIGKDAFHYCLNLTIHGHAGSYAEQYAKDNDIPFVAD